jgi:hypothetical protein
MPLVLNGTTGVQDNSGAFVRGTSVASTSGTSIDFTGIPSWVKRVTVMFNGVSTSGTSSILIQIGSGSVTTSGYSSSSGGAINATAPGIVGSTAGFIVLNDNASDIRGGILTVVSFGSNIYLSNHSFGSGSPNNIAWWGGGFSPTLSGVLDRVRITTVNGTDTFDAGSINILYE